MYLAFSDNGITAEKFGYGSVIKSNSFDFSFFILLISFLLFEKF
jgi:hypothetical protein